MHPTKPLLEKTDFPALHRQSLQTLQVNLGYRCNQSCLHCHVNAGPKRKEEMSIQTMDTVLEYLHTHNIPNLDLTGGAPELNPHFCYLVMQARKLGVHVIDRCNLTILGEPGQEDLADFLAQHQVEVIASLPCYLQENVEAQRGKGIYSRSMAGLKTLNTKGYGTGGKLVLHLVYNPAGATLPPPQEQLQDDYKKHLGAQGILFNQLFTITNMPIKRFGSTLVSKGKFHGYMQLLKNAHHPLNLDGVMCRSLISIDWRGRVYDCDFNQMLDLPLPLHGLKQPRLQDLMSKNLCGNRIAVAGHCYGCTAEQGSSCSGALNEA
ncbi:arsenosugar biosynthesis radical SAM (seleno)protein ArsS [Thiolapillus sp.]